MRAGCVGFGQCRATSHGSSWETLPRRVVDIWPPLQIHHGGRHPEHERDPHSGQPQVDLIVLLQEHPKGKVLCRLRCQGGFAGRMKDLSKGCAWPVPNCTNHSFTSCTKRSLFFLANVFPVRSTAPSSAAACVIAKKLGCFHWVAHAAGRGYVSGRLHVLAHSFLQLRPFTSKTRLRILAIRWPRPRLTCSWKLMLGEPLRRHCSWNLFLERPHHCDCIRKFISKTNFACLPGVSRGR